MIRFNEVAKPNWDYFDDIFNNHRVVSGDGKYTRLCSEWIEDSFHVEKALMMTSGTSALELAAILIGINSKSEVIMPSYTFCSTANAFILRGARVKFVDVNPLTMNIDETKIEDAITPLTRAIVPVHYGGVSCEMDVIMDIAKNHHLFVIEDAAQAFYSYYKGKACGTIGDYGCYSFHETKNYTMGEGGAICIHDDEKSEMAEIYREKGTDRSRFFRGQIDKYSWRDIGSSYLPSDLNSAYLFSQLEIANSINEKRLHIWKYYQKELEDLERAEYIELAKLPSYIQHNAHIFWIKVHDLAERTRLIEYLGNHEIIALFHYVPLHNSIAGKKYGEFVGEDQFTTKDSERLLRLPIYFNMAIEDAAKVVECIHSFYYSDK